MADTVLANTDSPEWFELSDQDREAQIQADFDDLYGDDPDFLNADPATQDRYRQSHRKILQESTYQSPYNPDVQAAIENQETMDRVGDDYDIFKAVSKTVDSHKDALDRYGMLDDVLPDGTVDSDFGQDASKYFSKQRRHAQTTELKKLANDISTFKKSIEKEGFWNDTKAWAKLAGDIITNPGGVMQVAAESTSSITAGAMGAWGGAKVGAAIGGASTAPAGGAGAVPGAATGAAAGMFVTMGADAASAKFLQMLQEDLDAQGIVPTAENIQAYADANPTRIKEIQLKSVQYGGVLGAVDVALGGFFSKMATLPTKMARRAAVKELQTAERVVLQEAADEIGMNIDEFIDVKIALKTQEKVNTQSFKKKLLGKGTAYAGEVAGEPLSEAAATGSIGEEIKAEDLIYETIGGVGAGPYGTAVNLAAFGTKTGAGQAKKKLKAALASPEDKAKIQEIKASGKKVVDTLKTRIKDPDYTKTIEEADPRNYDEIDAMADPENDKYNPLQAIDTLAKDDSIESLQKAKDIEIAHFERFRDSLTREQELEDKQKNPDTPLSIVEEAELKNLKDVVNPRLSKLQKEMQEKGVIIRERINAKEVGTEANEIDLKEATEEQIEENIDKTFGSGPQKKNRLGINQMNDILEDPNLRQDLRESIEAQRDALEAREKVSELTFGNKSMEEVSDDIYRGQRGSKFRGIDTYQLGIKQAVLAGNKEMANLELSRLKKFRDNHQEKADLMTIAWEANQSGKKPTAAQQKAIDDLKTKFNLVAGSARLVKSVQAEAAALNAEVKSSEAYMKSKDISIQQKAAQETSTEPVKPKYAIVTGTVRRNMQEDAKKMAKATTEQIKKRLDSAEVKYGPEFRQEYRDEIAKHWKAPVQPKQEPKAPEPVTQEETTEEGEIDLAALEDAVVETDDVVLDTIENLETTPVQEEISEENISTPEEDVDTVPDKLEAFAGVDSGDILVTVGKDKTMPYNEAISDINNEIEEAQAILRCCAAPRG